MLGSTKQAEEGARKELHDESLTKNILYKCCKRELTPKEGHLFGKGGSTVSIIGSILCQTLKTLVDENVLPAMQATLYDMYNDMYMVSKYISTETIVYSILRRLCIEEVESIIPPQLPVTYCRSVMVKVELKESR